MHPVLKDEKIDLCGELGHPDDDFPVLEPEQEFSFSCQGCGDCCRDRQDIVLSGYDLFRLCRRLRLPPQTVIGAFCRQSIGKVSLLPVVRLRPQKETGWNCPFLAGSRCSVHEAKPLVCALYPLGQTIDRDGSVSYFCQDTSCGGPKLHFTLNDYLDSFGIRERESLDVRWAALNLSLARRMRAAANRVKPICLKMAQRRILKALYLDYDYNRDYAPQWEENLARLAPLLDRLLGPEAH